MKQKQLATTFERDNVRIIITRHFEPEVDALTGVEITVQHRKTSITTTSLWLDDIADLTTVSEAIVSFLEMQNKKGGAQ